MLRLTTALLLAAAPALAGELVNRTAHIPPQCYTKTRDAQGVAHNPCQTCHTRARPPHYVNDQDLQLSYALPGPALVNPWSNLFVDRRAEVGAPDPDEILAWVRDDNYAPLAARLTALPEGWDADGDGRWSGYRPDAWFAFDEAGFDHAPDGRLTGWRAFAYRPLPGTFWPTNGSADDVLIRLPEAYRQSADGVDSVELYALNLAIVEALITRADVAIAATDEAALGVDLDRDGALGMTDRLAFAFAPKAGETMHWLGRAERLPRSEAPLAAGLFPLGTEFLHTVRYLDVQGGAVTMAARLKELRYMRKTRWLSYADRQEAALKEVKERADFPDRIRLFEGDAELGVANGTGWRLQGFIEDASGALRPQSFEETVFCVGCHGGVGATDDDTFAFARKLGAGAFQGGWYHWRQKGLAGTPDLIRADGTGDYAHYLMTNGAGDEFRANIELAEAWLEGGTLPAARAEALEADIAPLILPSAERALALNAAYRLIVREQSFRLGRDASLAPMEATVWREVEQDAPTGVTTPEAPWYKVRRR